MKRAPILLLCKTPLSLTAVSGAGEAWAEKSTLPLTPTRHLPSPRRFSVSWKSSGCITPPVATAPAATHVLEKCPFITTTRLLTKNSCLFVTAVCSRFRHLPNRWVFTGGVFWLLWLWEAAEWDGKARARCLAPLVVSPATPSRRANAPINTSGAGCADVT
jgi:hypothetical protein